MRVLKSAGGVVQRRRRPCCATCVKSNALSVPPATRGCVKEINHTYLLQAVSSNQPGNPAVQDKETINSTSVNDMMASKEPTEVKGKC